MKKLFLSLCFSLVLTSCFFNKEHITFTDFEKSLMVYDINDTIRFLKENDSLNFIITDIEDDFFAGYYLGFGSEIYYEQIIFRIEGEEIRGDIEFNKNSDFFEICWNIKKGSNNIRSSIPMNADTISKNDSILVHYNENYLIYSFQKGITKIVFPNDTLTLIED